MKLTNKHFLGRYRSKTHLKKGIITACLIFSVNSNAGDLTIPHTFTANTPALASDMNNNFTAIETEVDDNHAKVVALQTMVASMQTTITQLQTQLTAVQNNTVLSLDGKLMLSTINGNPTAEFTMVDVNVNNGTGMTTSTGATLGNLIIGYNETSPQATSFCSDPQYDNSNDCINNSGTWANNVRNGSHNLVMGLGNSYNSHASFVSGWLNVSNNLYTHIGAGQQSIASGRVSNISGGLGNITSGDFSSVHGGQANKAIGQGATIMGGSSNTASASAATVSGGASNIASGVASSVSGGVLNIASGDTSTVSGGTQNMATGTSSSVNGGQANTASGINSSASGGRNNTAIGISSNVSGGSNRSAVGDFDWVAGTLSEDI